MQLHTANAEIQFSSDGKFANSVRSRSRATKYKDAANLQEYFNSGATVSDYRNDVSRGVFHFRDTQLWDLQANSAANWSTLGSGGEEVTRDYFRKFMLSFTNRSQRWTKSDHRKIRRQYEADRRDAKLLHLTHKQYFAIKYARVLTFTPWLIIPSPSSRVTGKKANFPAGMFFFGSQFLCYISCLCWRYKFSHSCSS